MALNALRGIQAPEQTKPTSPPVGARILYAKATGWFDLDSAGTETNLFGTKITVGTVAPSSPATNDIWIDTT